MDTIEIEGRKYKPEDIDCNGRPYEDAVPINYTGLDVTYSIDWVVTIGNDFRKRLEKEGKNKSVITWP
jgi:hypothetical protein